MKKSRRWTRRKDGWGRSEQRGEGKRDGWGGHMKKNTVVVVVIKNSYSQWVQSGPFEES